MTEPLFRLKDCPPSLRHEFQNGYETTVAGIESAGPDGAHEIEQWGSDALTRLEAGALAQESFWFLHGVRLAIHEYKQSTECTVRPCDACTCQESEVQ